MLWSLRTFAGGMGKLYVLHFHVTISAAEGMNIHTKQDKQRLQRTTHLFKLDFSSK